MDRQTDGWTDTACTALELHHVVKTGQQLTELQARAKQVSD